MQVPRFLKHGIGLEDSTGTPIIHRGFTTIINLDRLRGLKHHEHLMKLWKDERTMLGDPHAANVPNNTFEHIPINQRRQSLSVQSNQNTIARFQQGIFRGDALALLSDFLDDRFPNGGLVNLAPPETQMYFQDTVPFQQRFDEFLNEHTDHPHHDTWFYKNTRIQRYAQDFYPNINILRPGSGSRYHQ
ncbi:predicted protein [Lichtheimia corymbifera JMRC:FSU:9682]|uniref:Uncharacterized protein n=1 Tax=Lichtheimia corymbifera JMRC:FSU:9682 TaxID=1263082 RepID=A0A068RHZ4_9FUNG|nr:predicted protein [Lichtheimia corymbifera JMRC:FSU:9682]